MHHPRARAGWKHRPILRLELHSPALKASSTRRNLRDQERRQITRDLPVQDRAGRCRQSGSTIIWRRLAIGSNDSWLSLSVRGCPDITATSARCWCCLHDFLLRLPIEASIKLTGNHTKSLIDFSGDLRKIFVGIHPCQRYNIKAAS